MHEQYQSYEKGQMNRQWQFLIQEMESEFYRAPAGLKFIPNLPRSMDLLLPIIDRVIIMDPLLL